MRDLIIGAIAVLWGGAALLRRYLQVRNKARAEITAEIKKQYGEQATVKTFSSKPRLLGLRVGVDSPIGTFGVGSSKEAMLTLEALRGRTAVKFNPADPQSVREAIRQYDREVDAKLGPYPQDSKVAEAANKLKQTFRQAVEDQVEKFGRTAVKQK